MRRSPIVAGLLLISVGLALFFLKDSLESRVVVFFLIGGGFLSAFLYERNYGFLVPGGILTGLGLGLLVEDWAFVPIAEPVPFGLGVGFLLIYALDTLYTRCGGIWPLFPGTILVLVGSGAQRDLVRWLFREGWPLVLVAAGVVLVLRGLLQSRDGDGAQGGSSTSIDESGTSWNVSGDDDQAA